MTARRAALALAVMLVGALVVLHLLGARAQVGILSGTVPETDANVAGGVGYALAWFGALLGAPILVLAVLVDVTLGSLLEGRLGRARGIVRIRTWITSRRR